MDTSYSRFIKLRYHFFVLSQLWIFNDLDRRLHGHLSSMYRSNCHQRRFQRWRETVLPEWKANCRRTKGPRGWPHPSRHQHGKALKLGRLLTRVVHVPPPCERVKYGVTRFPSKPVIRLEGVVPDLLPLSYLERCRSQTTSIPFLASLNRQTWFQEIAAYLVCKASVFRYVKVIHIASLLLKT